MGLIRDRIKELRRVKAGELIQNEKNWRKHPKEQREALQGILAEIGYADALIAYETKKGLKLIDGHLRASATPDTEVPVLVLDVSEAEANKLLASIDPLSAMAETDGKALDSLLGKLTTENDGLAAMLADLQEKANQLTQTAFRPELNPESGALPVTQAQVQETEEKLQGRFVDSGQQSSIREVCCPNCGAEFGLDMEDA